MHQSEMFPFQLTNLRTKIEKAENQPVSLPPPYSTVLKKAEKKIYVCRNLISVDHRNILVQVLHEIQF